MSMTALDKQCLCSLNERVTALEDAPSTPSDMVFELVTASDNSEWMKITFPSTAIRYTPLYDTLP